MKSEITWICIMAAMLVGCMGPTELDSIWTNSGAGSTESGSSGTTTAKALYITGIEYPEGVSWQMDAGSGVEGSTLFLMTDTVRLVELDIGADYCISSDVDMHRFIDGHLYTDYVTDSTTIIKRDGVRVLQFSVRETIESMYVKDGNIYTLGIPRSGSGWNYRCNGVNLMSRSGSSLIGELYEDSGQVIFAFSESISGSSTDKYFVVRDAEAEAVDPDGKASSIEDIRVIDENVHYVGVMSGKKGRYYCNGSNATVMDGTTKNDMSGDLQIYYAGGDVFIGGSYGSGSAVWTGTDLACEIDGRILQMTVAKDSYYCAVRKTDGGLSIYCEDEELPVTEGYSLIYAKHIATDGYECFVGLNRTADNMPAIWKSWQVTDLSFNGIVTGAWYQ